MHWRVSRVLAAFLLVIYLVGTCYAEVEGGVDTQVDADINVEVTADCNTENGECVNPEATSVHLEPEAEAREAAEEVPPSTTEDPHCPSRQFVIKCAGIYLDKNQNGKLEREELQSAIDKLPWYSRGILSILGSVDKMMAKCDMDGDGAISMDYDMQNNAHQCLASCFKRRAFKGAFFPECT